MKRKSNGISRARKALKRDDVLPLSANNHYEDSKMNAVIVAPTVVHNVTVIPLIKTFTAKYSSFSRLLTRVHVITKDSEETLSTNIDCTHLPITSVSDDVFAQYGDSAKAKAVYLIDSASKIIKVYTSINHNTVEDVLRDIVSNTDYSDVDDEAEDPIIIFYPNQAEITWRQAPGNANYPIDPNPHGAPNRTMDALDLVITGVAGCTRIMQANVPTSYMYRCATLNSYNNVISALDDVMWAQFIVGRPSVASFCTISKVPVSQDPSGLIVGHKRL
jgi:hypothetical protein